MISALSLCIIFSIVYGNSAYTLSSFRSKSISSRPLFSSFTTSTKGDVSVDTFLSNSDNKKPSGKEPEKFGLEGLLANLEKADKDPKSKKPPIYEPGPYPYRLLAALAYVVPIADAFDLGKYMFEAYPDVLAVYNSLFGVFAGIYNGVPFLPFAVFFLLSYICRAPNFPVEVRFHVSQAFMLSLVQFVPSLLFGVLEKAGVPGMAVLYNTGNTYFILSKKNYNIIKIFFNIFFF
jgi:hypothetical protein